MGHLFSKLLQSYPTGAIYKFVKCPRVALHVPLMHPSPFRRLLYSFIEQVPFPNHQARLWRCSWNKPIKNSPILMEPMLERKEASQRYILWHVQSQQAAGQEPDPVKGAGDLEEILTQNTVSPREASQGQRFPPGLVSGAASLSHTQ